MPNLSIKDVPEAWAEALRQHAARNHRSLQGELMAILERAATAEGLAPALSLGASFAGPHGKPPLRRGSKTTEQIFGEAEQADAAAQMAGKTLYAPYLLDHEVISVALKKRRLQWPADSLASALDQYGSWQIELRETDPKAPLATFDGRLAGAARTHLASLP